MTTAPTPSRAEELAQWLEQDWDAMGVPELLDVAKELRRLQAESERLLAQVHKLEMDALDLASENSILKRQEQAELEARKPLPLSYRSGVMTSSVDGGATVSLHFTDMAEAEAWFVEITDQYAAALVDKSPNLQETLVDKTANLQDRPAPLSDDEIIAAQEALALSRSRIGLPCARCGTGKYRADRNAYHDFHRCDSCMHVPMWGEDGKELGPPTCTGETS